MTPSAETTAEFWQQVGQWVPLLPGALLLFAVGAFSIARNLVRAALLLALAFLSLGILFLTLGAEFVGLAQILVYVGAVAMLMLFAILLTRPAERDHALAWIDGGELLRGFAIGIALAFILAGFIAASPIASQQEPPLDSPHSVASVRDLGLAIVSDGAAAVLALGVLLTAALVGAAILALDEKTS